MPALLPLTVLFFTIRVMLLVLEPTTCRPVELLFENVLPLAAAAPPIVADVSTDVPRICMSMPSPPTVPLMMVDVIVRPAKLVLRLSMVTP